jgi:eukaryotic-like serine/threonine-protein kinase
LPSELCPRCLLAAAIETKSEPAGHSGRELARKKTASALEPGQVFGHYRIIRSLGGGGMGNVFEAEDLDNSRRVALKVLSHLLDSPQARERFFREGRLAASINHPNSVYIFGTEEIAGTPVISMELLAGGTLQDQINRNGPMPPGKAVDAVLQIIEGLEAARKAGILHRDVKPSNCFVDLDGRIKIGDFGLSISTAVRTEPAITADGAFLGTPAFCPPEQLRGEELSVRSDMYSVGATLFYLLTGRTPFEASNTVALIAAVLEKPSPSPTELRPEISAGLGKVVQRTLHKMPGERHGSYSELRNALEPFSSAAPVPAPLGLRFMAGLVDLLILTVFSQVVLLLAFGGFLEMLDAVAMPNLRGLLLILGGFAGTVLYYALLEGLFGATLGKALCRLQVLRPDRNTPGIPRAMVRAALYVLLPALPLWITLAIQQPETFGAFVFHGRSSPYLLNTTPYLMMALLFSTARSRNGWKAVHDLVSKTQVSVRGQAPVRASPAQIDPVSGSSTTLGSIGPYQVLEDLGESAGDRWFVGFDLKLLRKVWIRILPASAEPVPVNLRNLGRPGRLRWLAGKRSDTENWDAFEAPGGQPFMAMAQRPQPWEQVRCWLLDLARELIAAKKDHTLPSVLSLHHVWITADQQPKLLDFPAPTIVPGGSSPPRTATANPTEFLAEFAKIALTGEPERSMNKISLPLPLYARDFLQELPLLTSMDEISSKLSALVRRVPTVSRLRRAVLVLGSVAVPLFAVVATFVGMRFLRDFEQRQPELFGLNQVLSMRQGMKFAPGSQRVSDRDFAIYIASHYSGFITNQTAWHSPLSAMMISGEQRAFAERSAAERETVSPAELARVEKLIKVRRAADIANGLGRFGLFKIIFYSGLLIYVAIPALLCALLFRGGFLVLLTRVAFVTRKGSRASRLRMFWRSVVAWTPVLVCLAPATAAAQRNPSIGVLGFLLVTALVGISLALPLRGIQDRLAGTWPVPR